MLAIRKGLESPEFFSVHFIFLSGKEKEDEAGFCFVLFF